MSHQYKSKPRAANVLVSRIFEDTFVYDFTVCQLNDDLEKVAVDLSQYDSAKMSIRRNEFSEPALTFHSTGTTNNIDIADLSIGHIVVSCPQLNLPVDSYLFDLSLNNTGITETILRGKFQVLNQFTE